MANTNKENQTQQAGTADELEQLKAQLAEKEKQVAAANDRAASAEKALAAANAEKALAAANADKEEKPAAEIKMVKIRIPRTRKDEPDVFASVNDYTCIVKRGVEVEVPDFIAEVLKHQEEMIEFVLNAGK